MVLNGSGLEKQIQENSLNLKQDSILDVDDLITSNVHQEQRTDQRGNKLEHAKQVSKMTAQELKTIVEGLDSQINGIGVLVSEAQTYTGKEKFFKALGHLGMKWADEKATISRHERMQNLDLKQAVQEIQNYTVASINQLGVSEREYKLDQHAYETKLTEVLQKQKEATPLYLAAMASRQDLESKVQTARDELEAGTVEQAERPHKEEQLEALQRQFHEAELKETTLLAIVKQAKENIPTLQKNRDAATNAIKAHHGARQDILEKFNDSKVLLERAATAMKATAFLEVYKSVDPALNKTIDAITANNIAAAGAALETWTDRIKHAAIDPQRSQELLQQLLGHIADAARGLQEVEDGVKNYKTPSTPSLSNDLD